LQINLKASATGGGLLSGSWQIISLQGEPAILNYIAQQQVMVAPVGAPTTPPSIRPLLPDEAFQLETTPGPMGTTSWMVIRTDIQSAAAEAFAALQAALTSSNETPGATQYTLVQTATTLAG